MAIINGLISLDEAKRMIFGNNASTQYDSDIEDYVSAATEVIEDLTGPMYPRTETRTFSGGSEMVAFPFAFVSVVSISEDGDPVTDFTALPEVGLVYRGTREAGFGSFPSGTANVTVSVTVGQTPIPPNVKMATKELVRHMWQIGKQGPRPAFNNEQMEIATTPSGFLVPRRVEQYCRPSSGLPGFA